MEAKLPKGYVLTVIVFVILLGIFSFICKSIYQNYVTWVDEYCQKKGYDKVTDWKEVGNGISVDYLAIECDGIMHHASRWNKMCVDWNKFGECTKRKLYVVE